MKMVTVTNNREHDITLNATGFEPVTIPAGRAGDGGKIVPGSAAVPPDMIKAACEQAVAAQTFFDEEWLQMGETTEADAPATVSKLTAAQQKKADEAAAKAAKK